MSVTEQTNEAGIALPYVAIALVMLFGFATLAVDAGIGFNARSQTQAAADSGALAGALQGGASPTAVRDAAQELVRTNLQKTYSDADWTASWTACADADRPGGFVSVPGTDCVSINNGAGLVRVRVPTQLIGTAFAKVIGFDNITVDAVAVASFKPLPLRPFGVPAGAGNGEYCLQQPPGGHAQVPCDGPDEGNFGSILVDRYSADCTLNNSDNLRLNLAAGTDHSMGVWVSPDPHVLDVCYKGGVNRLVTDTGNFPKPMTDGLISGGPTIAAAGVTPLLQQGDNPKMQLFLGGTEYLIDNRPLWDYLVANASPGCQPALFAGLTPAQATAQMKTCLASYAGGDLFDPTVFDSPRLMVIPQFVEPVFVGSTHVTIAGFRAVFVNRIAIGSTVIWAGDPGPFTLSGEVEQTSAFLLPNTPLIANRLRLNAVGVLAPVTVSLAG